MEHLNKDVNWNATAHPTGSAEGAKEKAQEYASIATARVNDVTHRVGEQIAALGAKVRHNTQQQGALGSAAASVAETLEGAGTYLQEKNFDHVGQDLTALVRRYPLPSLLVGVGLGFLLARSTEK